MHNVQIQIDRRVILKTGIQWKDKTAVLLYVVKLNGLFFIFFSQ
jgi:hypothetical protein